jgi:hypothetical protein
MKRVLDLTSWSFTGKKLTEVVELLSRHSKEFGPEAKLYVEYSSGYCDTCDYGQLDIWIEAPEKEEKHESKKS